MKATFVLSVCIEGEDSDPSSVSSSETRALKTPVFLMLLLSCKTSDVVVYAVYDTVRHPMSPSSSSVTSFRSLSEVCRIVCCS